MTAAVAPAGPADLRDQRWLDERVADLGSGIEAAREIWANWFGGRQVGRLHPGQTPGQYIASLGMRLSLPEALAALPDGSSREIAAVAGVGHMTVSRARAGVPNGTAVTGADGKTYPRVVREVRAEIIEERPEPEQQSDDYAPLMAMLRAVEAYRDTDHGELFDGLSPHQQARARASAARATKILGAMNRAFDADTATFVN